MKFRDYILFLLELTSVCRAFQWSQSITYPDNTHFAACTGEDIVLDWSYTTSGEDALNVEWRFAKLGSNTEMVMATAVHGQFFSSAGYNVQYVANAGIRLLSMSTENSGTYSVLVNVNHQGSIVTFRRTATITVTQAPLTTDDHLHASFPQTAMFVDSTQRYHLVLSCGTFDPLWVPRLSVVWTTPDNKTMLSTSLADGEFKLAIPNPALSGDYTCNVAPDSSAMRCLQSSSPVRQGAGVTVDALMGNFVLMENKLLALRTELEGQISGLESNNSRLIAQVEELEKDSADMKQQIEGLQQMVGVRLVGSPNTFEGRVEVWNGHTWGRVNHDNFQQADAKVVCRQLGLPHDTVINWGWSHFGGGSGPVLLDKVNCSGRESSLLLCPTLGPPRNDSYGSDAGVTCGAPPFELRLAGGASSNEGRVEIRVNGTWGTVYQYGGFYSTEAEVVCRQLGLPSENARDRRFGQGTGPVNLGYINCDGTEQTLWDCKGCLFGNELPSHNHDAGVVCRCENFCCSPSTPHPPSHYLPLLPVFSLSLSPLS